MNFDLNIDNYTKYELIDILDLPHNFDKDTIQNKTIKLINNIINNNRLDNKTKTLTISFLNKAKDLLNEDNNEKKDNLKQKIEDFYNSSYELKTSELENPQEHMVQLRQNKPYLSSYPSEFFPGIINPIKKRTIKKNLNIDTRFRENYYSTSSSNFNFNLPINIDNVLQMQLNAIELPNTFYVISKQYNNNYFIIKVNDMSAVIKIPDGNYTQISIIEIINKQLENAGSPFSYILFNCNLTYPTTGSGQIIVGVNNDYNEMVESLELNFQVDNQGLDDKNTPLPLKFGWLLGFRNGIYSGNLNYVSEGILDLTGSKYLYLVIDDYNNNVNNYFIGAFNSSILNKNILARISLQTSNFGILQQNNLNIISTPREYFGPIKLTSFNIQLLDEYGRIVNLNNMDFSFCLSLTLAYDL